MSDQTNPLLRLIERGEELERKAKNSNSATEILDRPYSESFKPPSYLGFSTVEVAELALYGHNIIPTHLAIIRTLWEVMKTVCFCEPERNRTCRYCEARETTARLARKALTKGER
jgi:hypothetical protein